MWTGIVGVPVQDGHQAEELSELEEAVARPAVCHPEEGLGMGRLHLHHLGKVECKLLLTDPIVACVGWHI